MYFSKKWLYLEVGSTRAKILKLHLFLIFEKLTRNFAKFFYILSWNIARFSEEQENSVGTWDVSPVFASSFLTSLSAFHYTRIKVTMRHQEYCEPCLCSTVMSKVSLSFVLANFYTNLIKPIPAINIMIKIKYQLCKIKIYLRKIKNYTKFIFENNL